MMLEEQKIKVISGANEGGNFLKTKLKTKGTMGEFRNERLKDKLIYLSYSKYLTWN
jgi:hypothetical protein